MGVRPDGVHVFGVLQGKDPRTGVPLMTVVEAAGYSIATTDTGQLLTLSTADGVVVEQFLPGTWEGVQETIPGVDVEE